MNLLWVVVLIQTLFFIVHNEHFYVLMFIGISLCINAFSKNEWFYLGLPILIVFMIYFFAKHNNTEGFKIKIKKPKIRKPSPPKVSIPKVKPPKKPSLPKVSVPKVSVPKVSVPKVSVPKIPEKSNENAGEAYTGYDGENATNAVTDAHNDSVNMMAQQQNALDQIMKNQLFLAEQLSG
jgi:hypothetical protein